MEGVSQNIFGVGGGAKQYVLANSIVMRINLEDKFEIATQSIFDSEIIRQFEKPYRNFAFLNPYS